LFAHAVTVSAGDISEFQTIIHQEHSRPLNFGFI
jgi:hypothetical protein